MGSSRLPGKSLADLGGHPVIDWVVERCLLADGVDTVVVATSSEPADEPLASHVRSRGWHVVRGDLSDVLDRYAAALDEVPHDRLIRVTGDCPFVQPELIDAALGLLDGEVEYVYTGHEGRFPRGFDVEAITRTALMTAHAEATDPVEREHVTPFVARRPERFSSVALPSPPWARRPDLRLTLDEADDLAMMREVVEAMHTSPTSLDGRSLIRFLDDHPDLAALNQHVSHNTTH
jgi:spore coat polysaccharide biosynthesis protein SpsF (cytidylyltransferase family)